MTHDWRPAGRRLLREPLLHFVVLGALVFAADHWLHREPRPVIVVSRAIQQDIQRELRTDLGREPTRPEITHAIERFAREEALYRDAVEQGLDRGDFEIRARLIAKALELQRSAFVVPDPTPAELERFLAEHRARYELSPRYDFEHVFVAGTSDRAAERAEALRRDLASGAAAAELGDPFQSGRAFVAQSRERVEKLFGKGFAATLVTLRPGEWRVIASDHGHHVVLLRLVEGGIPSREALGPRLLEDYRAAALAKAVEAHAEERVRAYEVKVEP